MFFEASSAYPVSKVLRWILGAVLRRLSRSKYIILSSNYSQLWLCTVDREIFAFKIIRVKNFRVIKFSRFRSIHKKFLTVDDCSMDKHLESSWRLVDYQVSGEPGIAGCSCRSDIYLGRIPCFMKIEIRPDIGIS